MPGPPLPSPPVPRKEGGWRAVLVDIGYNDAMDRGAHILIIEDDGDINAVMAASLAKAGYECTQAFSGSEGRLLLKAAATEGSLRAFDLVITDLMLPGASGEDLVREIRAGSDAPVIVVSARSEAADKVELLRLGADDYLAKPFDLDELHARVAVQLRHAARGGGRSAALRFKDWVIDPEARTLTAAGQPVKLTRLEYAIVETLARRPKKVFTKRELFEAAWNEECFVEEKAVNVHMSNIRGKLKASGTEGYIETVWGIGFKLAD